MDEILTHAIILLLKWPPALSPVLRECPLSYSRLWDWESIYRTYRGVIFCMIDGLQRYNIPIDSVFLSFPLK